MNYRREIDGLRAVAVIPVILFHAGFVSLSGGFIGVDIFFVISGYLITSIIINDIQKNQFSILKFYERRARRILPALTMVVAVTTVLSIVFLPAYLFKEYSQSLVAVATFSSNVFFFLEGGYFGAIAEEMPLLHTWSLSVEEQFYVFFPLLVLLVWSKNKKLLVIIISVLAILSLGFSEVLINYGQVDANFYLIFSRAWELFAGALIALLNLENTQKYSEKLNQFGSLIGIIILFFSITLIDNTVPFPGLFALAPILGTSLIIVFANSRTVIGRILGCKILVGIGLISYSLYLWHQPLFVLLRIKSVGEPPLSLYLLLIMVTFILSYFSWKYVEQPFRNNIAFNQKRIFKYSIISLFSMMVVGLAGHMNNGFGSRFESAYFDTVQHSPKRKTCHSSNSHFITPENACRYYDENVTWAALGDSHVLEPAHALAKRLEEKNEGLLHLSFSACPPAYLFETKSSKCSNWINQSVEYLINNNDIKNVLLAFRHSSYLFGDQLSSFPRMPDENPAKLFDGQHGDYNKAQARELYWNSFLAIIKQLRGHDKKVYILYPVPELPLHIKKILTPTTIFNKDTFLDVVKTTTDDYYFKRNEFILKKLNNLKYNDDLVAIKPYDKLCSNGYCSSIKNGKALYFDDDHLSIFGAAEVMKGEIF